MFPLPNKLVKFLLKSTIGKLVEEDFDWDAVEIQLLNGTAILNDLHLNKQLLQNVKGSFGFKEGKIKELSVVIPYSSFLQESCSMKIRGLEISVMKRSVQDKVEQMPVLSSSFHFAGDFLRNELDPLDENVKSNPETLTGLGDLAMIIENVIGKASLSIQDINISIMGENENLDSSLVLSIHQLDLKDHITNNFDIPSELMAKEDDILNHVVKYLCLKGISISHMKADTGITLLKIPVTWMRMLFSQQDHFENELVSPHPSVSDVSMNTRAESVVLSDFHIKTLSYGALGVVRLADVIALETIFGSSTESENPTSPNSDIPNSISDFNSNSPPSLFSFYLNSFQLYILADTASSPTVDIFEQVVDGVDSPHNGSSKPLFWDQNHLKLQMENVKFGNNSIGSFTAEVPVLKILEYRSQTYFEILSIDKYFDIGSSELYKPIPPATSSIFCNLNPKEKKFSFSIPPLFCRLDEPFFKSWKSYLPFLEHAPDTKKFQDQSDLTMDVHLSHLRILFDFGPSGTNFGVDLSSLHVSLENTEWNIMLEQLLFGIGSASQQELVHIASLNNLMASLTKSNGEAVGLSEGLIAARHEFCRENGIMDWSSAKSWSDVGSEGNSPSDKGEKKSSGESGDRHVPSKNDLMDPALLRAEIFFKITVGELVLLIQRDRLNELKGLIESLPKTSPTPNNISMASYFSIRQVSVTINNEMESHAVLSCGDVAGILALNHLKNLKNFLLLDIFVTQIDCKALLEDGSDWRILNTSSDFSGKRPIFHLILSQIDDFDVDIRQTVCTIDSNHLIVNIPVSLPLLANYQLFAIEKSSEDVNFSTFIDFSASLSHFCVAVAKDNHTLVGRVGNVKVTSNIISNSPTVGLNVALRNTHVHIGINPRIPTFFQNPIETQKISFLDQLIKFRCISVVDLDHANLAIRTNEPGVYPSMDYSVSFNQMIFETCRDSRKALMDFFASFSLSKTDFKTSSDTASSPVSAGDVDTFDSVDESAFLRSRGDYYESQSDYDLEMENLDDEVEWHMDFETTLSREDVLVDKVKVFSCATDFSLNKNFLNELEGLKTKPLSENPEIQFEITNGNISWRLFPGNDFFDSEDPDSIFEFEEYATRDPFQIELHLLKIQLLLQLFPEVTLASKKLALKIRDIEVYDRVPNSKFRKFFCYQLQDSSFPPRVTGSDMIDIELTGVHSAKEELRLKLAILPIQFSIDQELVGFLDTFFVDRTTKLSPSPSNTNFRSSPLLDDAFFRKACIILEYCEIAPISIQVDYKPKQVDMASIKQGEFAELVNLIHLDQARIFLNGIKLTGVKGWHQLVGRILSIWLPHIKSTQIPQMASGLAGVKTLVNLGSGIADLVLLPIEQYQKDGRIIVGLSRGTKSFVRATTKEGARLGGKLASGAQSMLEKVEIRNSLSDRDVEIQAVPAKLLKPLIRLTSSLADSLVKMSQGIDGRRNRK